MNAFGNRNRIIRWAGFLALFLLICAVFETVPVTTAFMLPQALEDYSLTADLTADDKAEDDQKNYQKADTEKSLYTTYYVKTAEWTDKANGEALIRLLYKPMYPLTENRVLICFPNCTSHGLSVDIVSQNIYDLLQENRYVDAIQIGVNTMSGADDLAYRTFTLASSDQLTKSQISAIFSTYSQEAMDRLTYVHELGSRGTGKGKADVLKAGSSISAALRFSNSRHGGGIMYLPFLSDYFDTIDANGNSGSLSTVFICIDMFATSYYNANAGYTTKSVYAWMKEKMGIDLSKPVSEENNYFNERTMTTVRRLMGMESEKRYIVLTPAASLHGKQISRSEFNSASYKALTPENKQAILNTLWLEYMFHQPGYAIEKRGELEKNISSWITSTAGKSFSAATFGAYDYNQAVSSLELSKEHIVAVQLRDAVDAAFEVDAAGITVRKNPEAGDSADFEYSVSPLSFDEAGNTLVTVDLSDFSVEKWSAEVDIPVRLKKDGAFSTAKDDFAPTNPAPAAADIVLKRDLKSDVTHTEFDDARVPSPVLYRKDPKPAPVTGDSANPLLWACLALFCASAAALIKSKRTRRR